VPEKKAVLELPTFTLDMDFGTSSFFGETTFDLGLDKFGSNLGLSTIKESDSPNRVTHYQEEEEDDVTQESEPFEPEDDPTMVYDSSALSTTLMPMPQDDICINRRSRPEGIALPESRPLSSLSLFVDGEAGEGGPKSSTPNATFLKSHQTSGSHTSSASTRSAAGKSATLVSVTAEANC